MESPGQLLERYRHVMPIDLNKQFYDIVVIHPTDSDQDLREARDYVDTISNGIRLKNGDDAKIVLFDDFAPEISSKVGRIAQAIQRCTLILIYVTENFDTDDEIEQSFFTETALAETLANHKTRNTLVPIYSGSVVKTPTMFQSLTAINTDSEYQLKKLGQLIDDKISVRKELETSQGKRQLEWAIDYHEQNRRT